MGIIVDVSDHKDLCLIARCRKWGVVWKRNDAVDEQHGVHAADLLSNDNSKYLTFNKCGIRPFMTVVL